VLSGEAAKTKCLVFGLTRSELETKIYRHRDDHANHYNTDAVHCLYIQDYGIYFCQTYDNVNELCISYDLFVLTSLTSLAFIVSISNA